MSYAICEFLDHTCSVYKPGPPKIFLGLFPSNAIACGFIDNLHATELAIGNFLKENDDIRKKLAEVNIQILDRNVDNKLIIEKNKIILNKIKEIAEWKDSEDKKDDAVTFLPKP